MRATYRTAMEWLYIACILLAAVAMVVITIIIPYGVFMRYVMDSAASWPEPAGILMMIVFSFIGGAAAYREMLPLAVEEYRSAVAGFGGKQTEWLRRATLRMIGNIGVELLRARPPRPVARPPAVRPAVSSAAPRTARPPRGR